MCRVIANCLKTGVLESVKVRSAPLPRLSSVVVRTTTEAGRETSAKIGKVVNRVVWAVAGTAMAVPLVASLFPTTILSLLGNHITKPRTEEEANVMENRKEEFKGIMKQVGVKNIDKVVFVETDTLGPTTIGSDVNGAVVLVPSALLYYSELDETTITPELREKLLESEGTLLPTKKELNYILGHEAVHIQSNHSLKGLFAGYSIFGASLGCLKLLSKVSRSNLIATPAMRTISSLLLTSAIVSGFCVFQEKEADTVSAKSLHCKDEALQLVQKKLKQNLFIRNQAAMNINHHSTKYAQLDDALTTLTTMITRRGNSILEWEHPWNTWQLRYLSELENDNTHIN